MTAVSRSGAMPVSTPPVSNQPSESGEALDFQHMGPGKFFDTDGHVSEWFKGVINDALHQPGSVVMQMLALQGAKDGIQGNAKLDAAQRTALLSYIDLAVQQTATQHGEQAVTGEGKTVEPPPHRAPVPAPIRTITPAAGTAQGMDTNTPLPKLEDVDLSTGTFEELFAKYVGINSIEEMISRCLSRDTLRKARGQIGEMASRSEIALQTTDYRKLATIDGYKHVLLDMIELRDRQLFIQEHGLPW